VKLHDKKLSEKVILHLSPTDGPLKLQVNRELKIKLKMDSNQDPVRKWMQILLNTRHTSD
jgi:hypothetical protein